VEVRQKTQKQLNGQCPNDSDDGDDEQTQPRVVDEWIGRRDIMRIQGVVVVVGFLLEVSHGIQRRCIRG
jgi:hypothetical protein